MDNKLFTILDQINTTRSKLLEQIKLDGPQVLDTFADIYADLDSSEKSFDSLKIKNIFMSLIAFRIEDPSVSKKIFELGLKHEYIMLLFMKQLLSTTDILSADPTAMMGIISLKFPTEEFVDIMLTVKKIPMTKSVALSNEIERKTAFRKKYGYVIPSQTLVEKIVEFSSAFKILEIGSGAGFLAHILQYWGVTVTATDIGNSGGYDIDFSKMWVPIDLIGYERAIQKYGSTHNTLLLAWSPETDMAYKAIKLFTGAKIIYIGECGGGSTASDAFFSLLREKFVLNEKVKIPNWCGTYSKMYFYLRK